MKPSPSFVNGFVYGFSSACAISALFTAWVIHSAPQGDPPAPVVGVPNSSISAPWTRCDVWVMPDGHGYAFADFTDDTTPPMCADLLANIVKKADASRH